MRKGLENLTLNRHINERKVTWQICANRWEGLVEQWQREGNTIVRNKRAEIAEDLDHPHPEGTYHTHTHTWETA